MIKKNIKAVHDKDLEQLLASLGILEDIKEGRKRCKFCDTTISLDNLETIFPEAGDIKFSCEKAECVKKLFEFTNNNRLG